MTRKSIPFLMSLICLVFCLHVSAQNTSSLPRSTPELQGVSSEGILKFLEAIEKSNHEFHSFMFLRHGNVIAEGWWSPYRSDLKHMMYSLSKSFTSTAIGFAVSENRLKVTDKVITFFPDALPDTISDNLRELSIKDLLSMSAGQTPDPTASIRNWDTNWIKSFLSVPIINKPGTKFLYNSVATFMLSAIVQKVTGEKVVDYLKPRLFEPLGIEGMDWEVNPAGINTGGWGLRIKTEDMAKFGQLYLQRGNWKGRQIIPEEWVEEATSVKILQNPDAQQSKRDSSDWLQGYCYQFWRCRYNAFRGDGAFGQFIIVMPEQDAVVAITAESNNLQDEINLVWKYLLPSIHVDKLPTAVDMTEVLRQKLSSLALPLASKSNSSKYTEKISDKTFKLEPNEKHLESISFQFKDSICTVTLKTDTDSYSLPFGSGTWVLGETLRRGPNLIAGAKGSFIGLPPLKIAGSFVWKDENNLELTLRYIESPHTERIICSFDQNKISVDFQSSLAPKSKQSVMKGELSTVPPMYFGVNKPIGTARGIYPGRVVWVHDSLSAQWNGSNGFWWEDKVTSQTEVKKMLNASLASLTGEEKKSAAWDKLFRYFNNSKKNIDRGYNSTEKIAIKVNENNTYSHKDNEEINASPQLIYALLQSLIVDAKVPQKNITVFDASRFITDNIFNKCHLEFPDVIFVDNTGGEGRVKSEYIDNAIPYSVDNGMLARGLAKCVVEADYVINMALLKGHVGQGVTLCGKNYYGTTSIDKDWRKNHHNNFGQDKSGKPKYMTFVDFLGHKDLGEKTMLFMIDGIYGAKAVDGIPKPKWKMEPFNYNWPCSLFLSQDGVAIDAVALDFLSSEWPDMIDISFADAYLVEAALANDPPSKTFYDPERDNIRCKSLGVMEHWNNSKEKKYSRNLGKQEGIELIYKAINN